MAPSLVRPLVALAATVALLGAGITSASAAGPGHGPERGASGVSGRAGGHGPHSGEDAVASVLGGRAPALAKPIGELVDSSVTLDGALASDSGVLTGLPTAADPEIESVYGQYAISARIEGLTALRTAGDAVVGSDLEGSSSFVTHATVGGGFQVVYVAQDSSAPSSFSLDTEVPEGATWRSESDGSLSLVDETSVTIATVAVPWAVDATGRALPTSFAVAGGRITQSVDTTGAVFPVVADPNVLWWVATTATCIVELAPFFLPTVAAKIAQALVKAQSIIKKSAKLSSAISKLGGLAKTLDLIKTCVQSRGAAVAGKLTQSQVTLIKSLLSLGINQVADALGIGSCDSLVREIVS